MPVLVICGGLLLCLDQASKRIVQAPGGRAWRRLPYCGICAVWHRREVYEITAARIVLVLVWVLAATSAVLLYRSGTAFQSVVGSAGLGAALGGAAGNLADILRRRAILNFVHIGWWLEFNFADVGIIGGLVLAFVKA